MIDLLNIIKELREKVAELETERDALKAEIDSIEKCASDL